MKGVGGSWSGAISPLRARNRGFCFQFLTTGIFVTESPTSPPTFSASTFSLGPLSSCWALPSCRLQKVSLSQNNPHLPKAWTSGPFLPLKNDGRKGNPGHPSFHPRSVLAEDFRYTRLPPILVSDDGHLHPRFLVDLPLLLVCSEFTIRTVSEQTKAETVNKSLPVYIMYNCSQLELVS